MSVLWHRFSVSGSINKPSINVPDLFLLFSPGRSCGTFDNEIVMMNHVYKERFPKVCCVLFAPLSSLSHTPSLGDL